MDGVRDMLDNALRHEIETQYNQTPDYVVSVSFGYCSRSQKLFGRPEVYFCQECPNYTTDVEENNKIFINSSKSLYSNKIEIFDISQISNENYFENKDKREIFKDTAKISNDSFIHIIPIKQTKKLDR